MKQLKILEEDRNRYIEQPLAQTSHDDKKVQTKKYSTQT